MDVTEIWVGKMTLETRRHTIQDLCAAFDLSIGNGVPKGGGGLGVSTQPPPPNSESPPKSCQTQPDCENLKIAEFRTPTHQDVRKKGSKILKRPRFAIVLH